MSQAVLDQVVAMIGAAPQSAAALTLYALVSTLEAEPSGCLFRLTKLRDLSADQRELAYRLIELMVQGDNRGGEWDRTKARLDALIRAG